MILVYKCNKCSETFKLPFKADDRGELNMHKPNLKQVCKNCDYENKLKINDIKAVKNPIIEYAYGIALLVDVILAILFFTISHFQFKETNTPWQYYAVFLIFLVPMKLAKVVVENEEKAVQLFNRYYV